VATYSGDGIFAGGGSSVSFTVARAATTIAPARLLSHLFVPRATLRRSDDGTPIAGQTVQFSSGRLHVCSAVTDSSGVATCSHTIAISTAGITATYSGNADYLGSAKTAPLL
jgi:hypothetical protein